MSQGLSLREVPTAEDYRETLLDGRRRLGGV